MKWIVLVCMLHDLLHLACAVCEQCNNGQSAVIPRIAYFRSPSPFNGGTDGSLTSFNSTCTEINSSYHCINNINNPLFECNTNNNDSYYGWDRDVSFSLSFASHFQSMNILMTFLVSTSSNASAPRFLQFGVIPGGPADPGINLPTNLPEGTYQHNYTLSPGVMFSGIFISTVRHTTIQWVAINRIILCPVTTVVASSSDDDSVSVAVVIGAVVGTLLLTIIIIIIIIMIVMIVCRRRKKSRRADDKNVQLSLADHPQQHAHNNSADEHDPTSRLETVNSDPICKNPT